MPFKDLEYRRAYHRTYQRELRLKNPTKAREKDRKERANNGDKKNERTRNWRTVNKDNIKKYNKNYRLKNKEEIKMQRSGYHDENRDIINAKKFFRYGGVDPNLVPHTLLKLKEAELTLKRALKQSQQA